MTRWVALGVVFLAACIGASSQEVEQARAGRYTCAFEQVYDATSKAMEEVFYHVAAEDARSGTLVSERRWYEQNGTPRERGTAKVFAEDVNLVAEARLIKNGPSYSLAIAADVVEYLPGSPQGRRLTADDPNRPTWVQGKLDRMAMVVHERLRSCAQASARR
jgi:hypothetical protein